MKILSATQIKALDAHTIQHDAIESIDLMERACRAFFNWFVDKFHERCTVGIVCGIGNNGGDGLGIARMLSESGYNITIWIVQSGGTPTADFTKNLERAKLCRFRIFEIIQEDKGPNLFESCDIIIDALFGSGLNRPVEGLGRWVIEQINNTAAARISVDIPSGLMADAHSAGTIVRADHTITFQLPKLAFFLPEYHQYVGEWVIVDIGLNRNFIKQSESSYRYVLAKGARRLLKRRSKFDHKGTYGHALLIAGSLGKMGAAVLSARAALRSGLGLLTIHVPSCGNNILQTSVPEAMLSLDRNEEIFSASPSVESYTAIGIGPGIGKGTETTSALRNVLEHSKSPMVIDADALNILSENKEMMHLVPKGSILTPHPKEFERLVGKWNNDFERLEKQTDFAVRLGCVIVVKGAYTSIATPAGAIFFNSTGNPGMATGGTGDVLTGILTGLLSQKYDPAEAAVLGVFVHGMSGDLAMADKGMNGLIASDIIDFLPKAMLFLRKD